MSWKSGSHKARLLPSRRLLLRGDNNGAPHPLATVYAKKFSNRYEHRIISGGIGHNLPQEAPQPFARADTLRLTDIWFAGKQGRKSRIPMPAIGSFVGLTDLKVVGGMSGGARWSEWVAEQRQ